MTHRSSTGWRAVVSAIQSAVTALQSARVYTFPARALNSAFQISTTRDARVSYSVDIACVLTLVTGQAGAVFLEYADNSGMSTNLHTVARSSNANTGTLSIGLALTETVTGTLSGDIPAGKYVRLRTSNVIGTPTFTAQEQQEVLL